MTVRGGLLFPFLIGLIAGGVLIWALGVSEKTVATTDRARAPHVTAPSVKRADPAGTDAVPDAADPGQPRVQMPDAVADALAELERAKWREDENASGLMAIAYLYALAGRDQDFLRVAGVALAHGAEADEILDQLEELPKGRLAPAMQGLLAAHADVEWDLKKVAAIFFAGDAPERGIAILERGVLEDDDRAEFAKRFVAHDPDRAVVFLTRFLSRGDWSGGFFSGIAGALIEKGKPQLARPFLQRALELTPAHDDALDMLTNMDPSLARAFAEKRVKEFPEDGKGWTKLALLRQAAGDRGGAFAAMQEALKYNNGDEL
ncbi:MAG: hypothetical protein OER88_09385, partial [Planctomycetota bacterium]|nr:hypothetical protein [Planctomycetota bacterium]